MTPGEIGQIFLPTGYDGHEMTFMCPSLTSGEEYEVVFDVRLRLISCSCPDAVCRGKNMLPLGHERLCKHCRLWTEIVWPTIEKALAQW